MEPRSDSRSDADLIGRSLKTPELFGEIYARHGDAIAEYAIGRINRDRSEDVVAEVFVTAFRKRHKYDLRQPDCLPWLYGIARNVVRNEYRWWQRHKLDKLPMDAGHVVEDIADRVVERLDAQRLLALIAPTIDSLRSEERISLELAAEGRSYSEIAARLDCEVGTVKSRISRARVKILAEHKELPHG